MKEQRPGETEERLPPEVVRCLDEYRARARKFALVKGAGVTLIVYVAVVIAIALLDRFLPVPRWLRAMLSFGSMSGIVAFAYYAFVAPFFFRPGARQTALDLERSDPGFNEALVTAVDHLATRGMPRGASAALVSEIAKGSAGVAGALDVRRVLPARLVKRIVIVSGVTLAVFGALFAVPGLGFARLVARFHAPLANLPRASLIELEIEPGSTVVGTGDSVEIRARMPAPPAALADRGPVVLHVRHERESWSESEMTEIAGAERAEFLRRIDTVTSTFDYYVTAGPAESAMYRIVAVERPLPEVFRVTYEPPAYTGAAAVTEEGPTGAVRGLKGSRVRLTVQPSVPLTRAEVVKDGLSIPMEISREGMLASCGFDLEKDGSYSLRLEGEYGLASTDDREYPIRALDDAPPTVNAALVGATSRLSVARRGVDPDGALCVRYRATDDWGVEGARSQVSLNGGEAVVKNVPLARPRSRAWSGRRRRPDDAATSEGPDAARPGRRIAGEFLVDLKSLGTRQGDHVSIIVSARDSLGQIGRSRAIMIWLGRDVVARAARERAGHVRAAAEAVREMERLRKVLRDDRAVLAGLMRRDGWSREREQKLAEVRHLEHELQAKAEEARAELRAARELARDDLARALSVASRRLLRVRSESDRLDEALGLLDMANEAPRERMAEALERASEDEGLEKLRENLEAISTGERAGAALERDGALAERRERLRRIREGPGTPALGEFVGREEDLMGREREELGKDAKELGLDVNRPRWREGAAELVEKGRQAADELLAQTGVADELAALAEEARELAEGEAGLARLRREMRDLQAELAQAARDETELGRPDYALARDEDLTRAALQGMQRRNLADAREAANRMAGELAEAAEARRALENAAEVQRDQEGREREDRKALDAAERRAEAARDTLARLAGDPAEALGRLAAREEDVAREAARTGDRAEEREDFAEVALTQAHLAGEAARLAERLMHEANAETAAREPDAGRIAALDELREDIEKLVQGDMNAAQQALEAAALGEADAAEQASRAAKEAAGELARLAKGARRMAEAEPALAALEEVAGLEAAQRELADRTWTSDANDRAEGQELSREQRALVQRSREAMEAIRAQQERPEAVRDAAADAAREARALAEAAGNLSQELGETGDAAGAEPEAANVARGTDELAQTLSGAPEMQDAAQSAARAAQAAEAGHRSTQTAEAQPAAGQFAQAAEDLARAAQELTEAAAAAEAALTPGAIAGMQTATTEQASAVADLAAERRGARTRAHESQMAAADALARARRELAQAVNSARTQEAAARPPAQARAMTPSGAPGGSDRPSDGRVVGEAPPEDRADWGRLRETEDASRFAEREGITSHYADPIRLYFEAVAREGRRE